MRFAWVLCILLAVDLKGETPAETGTVAERQAAMRARMEAAVARQKQAVRRQLGTRAEAEESFFTVTWSSPAVVAPPQAAPQCPPLAVEEVDRLVAEAAQREGLQPELLRSVMAQESGFHPCAVSAKGAQGLMQLMPDTAAELGVKDPFDPRENVASGAKLLKTLLQRYGGNVQAALSAYNAGPARVDAAGGAIPNIAETVQYVQRILAALGH